MSEEEPRYLSYLVRLWRDDDRKSLYPSAEAPYGEEGTPTWRASMERALTGRRQVFANLDDLFEFLRRETGMVNDVEENELRAE